MQPNCWDGGLALRLAGAAAVALGFHAAWRVLQRPRPPGPAPERCAEASEPLGASSTDEETAGKSSHAAEPDRRAAVPRTAAGAAQPHAADELPLAVDDSAAPSAPPRPTAAPPTPEQWKTHAAAAAAALPPPAAAGLPDADDLPGGVEEAPVFPSAGMLPGGVEEVALLPVGEEDAVEWERQLREGDPTDVAAVPLGSPFVPPLLAAGPDAAAVAGFDLSGAAPTIPLFSNFVPPPPAAGSAAAAAAAAALAQAAAASEAGEGGSPPSVPRHRRRRSLLSEGLEQQEQQEAGTEVGSDSSAAPGLPAEERQLLAELAELREAAAAGAAAGPSGLTGRPVGLRVEVPSDPYELPAAPPVPPSAAAWPPQQRDLQPPAEQQQQQQQLEALPSGELSRGGTPVGFDQQQCAAEAAAAAAEYFAAAPPLLPGRGGAGGPTPDSVAAALQRAVELAASGPGTMGGGAPCGAAGHPHALGTRGTLGGGTFRSATLPAPMGPPQSSGDSAWGLGISMLQERSAGLHMERHLPRLSEEIEGVRASVDVDVPLACKLDVVGGPCSSGSYTSTEDVLEIIIGRNQGVTMHLNDGEVSGQHAAVRWSSVDKCWKVVDLGSLNGTLLNGEPISVAGRKRGRDYRLSSDDILQLGSFTKIKVSTFPRDLLDPLQSRCGSLPVGSMPRSLTMPKHRIPSFTSLLSPKITNTPSKKATVAAASDELRLECCIISRTGRDHQRKGQTCEDVACAECPLHGSEEALDGSPAALFCVFDGHCGRAAADAASTALPDEVSTRLRGVRDALAAAQGAEDMLHAAFLATDEAISAEEGCTATAVLMWRDGEGAVCLQCANVGDSASLFIDPDSGRALELTEDHRLTNPRERQRLQDMGIQLASNARRLYGLNLCRGLGDKFLKDEDLGLSAEPHVSGMVRLAEQQGCILLIASDGLWDVTDVDAVTAVIVQADREQDGSVLEITQAVISHAMKQHTKDDVTALVVRVWPSSEWELRSPTKNLDDGEVAAFVS